MYFLGIDVGGTFTDIVVVDEAGKTGDFKTETTPGDLSLGLLNGIKLAAENEGASVAEFLRQIGHFSFGTTAATNAFIQRKGSKTGLITTRGFADTVFISRLMGMTAGLSKEEIPHYSVRYYPVPLVPPALIKEVTERVDYKGTEIVPLDEDEVKKAVRELVAQGVESVAVCFLWSFRHPGHEQRVKEIIARDYPNLSVTLSSELVPVVGEYERTATTIINAFLRPAMSAYFQKLTSRFGQMGLQCPVHVLTSFGGVFPSERAGDQPVALLESGPAGGLTGSLYLGDALGYKNIITGDMGGTSFDVGLVVGGSPLMARRSEVERYHILLPMVDIVSIGSGGGSIARVEDGYLKVGPFSAGAEPGPVCYDKGGTQPTVTDADVALGIIDPDYFLGGRKKLNKQKAEAVIHEKIAKPLGLSLVEAAAGIKTIVDSQMADLLRKVTLERGYDPREFVLFAFGGAGPTHCSAFGTDLGVKSILVPSLATSHSAYGAVASNIRYFFEISDPMRTPAFFDVASRHLDAARVTANFSDLEGKAMRQLAGDSVGPEDMLLERHVGMRFRRQTHELFVPAPRQTLTPEDIDELVRRFEGQYEDTYGPGSSYRQAGVELSTFRVIATGKTRKPVLNEYPLGPADANEALKKERQVYFTRHKRFINTRIYDGTRMKAGHVIAGPAIIEYPGTTVVVEPEQQAAMDRYLNVVIDRKGDPV